MPTYDVIVIGTGGVGSAALWHLARRGVSVLGLDRFPGGHDRGSSHGQTRAIRQAYFEHPDYVPLLRRAYELWAELEQRRGQQLYFETGLLEVGPPDGIVVPGVLASARQHNLEVERLTLAEVHRRFPGFELTDDFDAVFESRAGYLLVEQCVLAHLEEAKNAGAELCVGENVVRWNASDDAVTVETETETYNAARLLITAGAWAGQLLADLGIRLRVTLKHLHWFANEDARYRQDQGCPVFFYETADGFFYGFPQFDDRGVKVAEHSGGHEVADPLNVNRSVDPQDLHRVEQFLAAHLPGVTHQPTAHTTCFYTHSPDDHFIIDRHSHHPQITFVAGLSGHGFKFTSVLGEVLAALAIDGTFGPPIAFLRHDRFRTQ